MAFKTNTSQQLSLDDSFISLTSREKKALENSRAQIFADGIFPAIDEERFSVLYSDKAPRPNTPVNVIIGALINKELFDYLDAICENDSYDKSIIENCTSVKNIIFDCCLCQSEMKGVND